MPSTPEAVELFKEALTLSPDDDDIRHNFELSKMMLEQQPPQEQQNQSQDGGEDKILTRFIF